MSQLFEHDAYAFPDEGCVGEHSRKAKEGASKIDLKHVDVTRQKGSMVGKITLKFKMASSSASGGGNSKSKQYLTYLKLSSRKSPEPPNPTRTHVSISAIKFPASGKYGAILDSCVTTTTTMHVRAAKELLTSLCIRSITQPYTTLRYPAQTIRIAQTDWTATRYLS